MENHLVSVTNGRDKAGGGMFSRAGFKSTEIFPIITKREAIVNGKDKVFYVSKVHRKTTVDTDDCRSQKRKKRAATQ